jgi:hypothetical protein
MSRINERAELSVTIRVNNAEETLDLSYSDLTAIDRVWGLFHDDQDFAVANWIAKAIGDAIDELRFVEPPVSKAK